MIHQETYCDVSGRFSVREFCIRVQQQQQQLIMVMVEMLDLITLVVSSLCFLYGWIIV